MAYLTFSFMRFPITTSLRIANFSLITLNCQLSTVNYLKISTANVVSTETTEIQNEPFVVSLALADWRLR